MLHEEDRVGVAHARDDEALGVLGRARRDDLDAGRVHEPRLGVLRVKRAAGEAAAAGQPHGDVHRQALAVVHLRGDVDELVEAAGDEVRELHLADRPHPDDRCADRAADDPGLRERRVHDAVGAELVEQPSVTLNAPPKTPMSSPIISTRSSARISVRRPSEIALRYVISLMRETRSTGRRRPRAGSPARRADGRRPPSRSRGRASARRALPRRRVDLGLDLSRSASTSTPSAATRALWRSIGSFLRHSSTSAFGTYFMSSCAPWPCMRIVTASMSVGPPPAIARSRA